jgi:Protein of unknown function (DUF3102)
MAGVGAMAGGGASRRRDRGAGMTDIVEGSNRLPELAARIKAEHEATAISLRRGVQHGMAAGDLLIEAKALLKHGQWLPWLRDHCAMSERSAQLYMRLAKNRTEIEANTKQVADLTMNETAALLMLSSDIRKLLELAKTMKDLDGEGLIDFCIANDVGMLKGNIFDAPEPTDQEEVEWHLFILWLRRTQDVSVEGASLHADWVQSRGTLLADWMKPNPLRDAWMPIAQGTIDHWAAFLEANRGRTLDDVKVELDALRLEDQRSMTARPRAGRKRASPTRTGRRCIDA